MSHFKIEQVSNKPHYAKSSLTKLALALIGAATIITYGCGTSGVVTQETSSDGSILSSSIESSGSSSSE